MPGPAGGLSFQRQARLAQLSGASLRLQAQAGASAVQLFDSWVGVLSRKDYESFVLPHSGVALAAVAELDIIISHSSGKKKTILTTARNKLQRHSR